MGNVLAATADSNASLFLNMATGENRNFLLILAVMMGLGKGGVPGSSMMAVALNAINAPDLPTGPGSTHTSILILPPQLDSRGTS